jgi:N-methylhydantoinase B
VVFGCLRQAIPDRVPAEGTSCIWTLVLRGESPGANARGPGYTISAVTNGGTGGRPGKDGLSATAYPSGVKGTPVEITEASAPILFRRKELRPDSGGAGRHRGGHGQIIEVETTDGTGFEILAAFDRVDNPARGCDGGDDGANGHLGLASGRKMNGKGFQDIPAGDSLLVLTPGGGGIGAPAERDPASIATDLRDGLISDEVAAQVYGFAGTRARGASKQKGEIGG